jgi:phosphoribosyl-dephospho-CoA transferase
VSSLDAVVWNETDIELDRAFPLAKLLDFDGLNLSGKLSLLRFQYNI